MSTFLSYNLRNALSKKTKKEIIHSWKSILKDNVLNANDTKDILLILVTFITMDDDTDMMFKMMANNNIKMPKPSPNFYKSLENCKKTKRIYSKKMARIMYDMYCNYLNMYQEYIVIKIILKKSFSDEIIELISDFI